MLDFMKEKQETSSDKLDVDAIRKRIEGRHMMTFSTINNMRSAIDACVRNINQYTYLVSPYSHTTFEFVRRTRFYMNKYQNMLHNESIDLMKGSYDNHSLTEVLDEIYLEISNIMAYVCIVEERMLEGATV